MLGGASDQAVSAAAAAEAEQRHPSAGLGVGRRRGSMVRGAGASERHRGHARRHGVRGDWKGMVVAVLAVAAVAVEAVVAVYSQPESRNPVSNWLGSSWAHHVGLEEPQFPWASLFPPLQSTPKPQSLFGPNLVGQWSSLALLSDYARM